MYAFYIVLFKSFIDVLIYFLFIVKSDIYFERLKGSALLLYVKMQTWRYGYGWTDAYFITFALKMRKVMFWSPCIYLFVCVLLA